MSEEKKLSKDRLKEALGIAVQNAIEYFVVENNKEFKKKIPLLQKAHQQLLSLIESSAQEPSEAEVDVLVEKWGLKFPVACAVDYKLNQKNIKALLKEYRELLRKR